MNFNNFNLHLKRNVRVKVTPYVVDNLKLELAL